MNEPTVNKLMVSEKHLLIINGHSFQFAEDHNIGSSLSYLQLSRRLAKNGGSCCWSDAVVAA